MSASAVTVNVYVPVGVPALTTGAGVGLLTLLPPPQAINIVRVSKTVNDFSLRFCCPKKMRVPIGRIPEYNKLCSPD